MSVSKTALEIQGLVGRYFHTPAEPGQAISLGYVDCQIDPALYVVQNIDASGALTSARIARLDKMHSWLFFSTKEKALESAGVSAP